MTPSETHDKIIRRTFEVNVQSSKFKFYNHTDLNSKTSSKTIIQYVSVSIASMFVLLLTAGCISFSFKRKRKIAHANKFHIWETGLANEGM